MDALLALQLPIQEAVDEAGGVAHEPGLGPVVIGTGLAGDRLGQPAG